VGHSIGDHSECFDPTHLKPFVRALQPQSVANDDDVLKRLFDEVEDETA
jgi:hypothetical protein